MNINKIRKINHKQLIYEDFRLEGQPLLRDVDFIDTIDMFAKLWTTGAEGTMRNK